MTEQLDEIQWKSPEFIQERGLHTANVLEYFALSPFYDRTSNNQVLMMQFQFQQIQIPMDQTFQQFFDAKLREMKGIEFTVAYTREPDFWVVRKQKRSSPTSTQSIQDYYIIGANVYQAPRIYDVLSSRLLSSVLSLKNTVEVLNKMTSYSLSDGAHTYNFPTQKVQQNQKQKQRQTPSQTPQTASVSNETPTAVTVGSSSNFQEFTDMQSVEVTAATYDSLLSSVVKSSGGFASTAVTTPTDDTSSVFIDDIPLYGKRSTVEMLGVRVFDDED